mgnify:CR=1 FL=1
MNYTIRRYNYNLARSSYITEFMAEDGLFYCAIAKAPKLNTVSEAQVFFATHAYKHHNAHKDCYIVGPKGGHYPLGK